MIGDHDAWWMCEPGATREPIGDALHVPAQRRVGIHVEAARLEVALGEPAGARLGVVAGARVGQRRAKVARAAAARSDRDDEPPLHGLSGFT